MQNFMEWRVVLDIVLITLLFYSFYRTLRATGTWKIALGLTFTAGFALLARLIGLKGLEWIFSNLSQIAVVALLIIFQPEIRRILERSFSFGHRRRIGEEKQTAEIIDQALFDLAERQWGALLVFPGEVPVKQWVTEGVRVDAVPSPQFLLSLFDPNSPGHDGAAVMDGERISYFSAHLPLSRTNRLSKELGTRHHAAMGLGEKTDALVLAVSEERGVVTAFRDGEMLKVPSRGDAARLIHEHYQLSDPFSRRSIKKKKNTLLAFAEIGASFSIAVLLWLTLIQSGTEIREMLFTVPIEYGKTAKNIQVIGKQAEAKLLLEGPLDTLRSIDPSQLRVQFDLSPLEPGTHKINLSDATIIVPGKLRLLDIQPEGFEMEIKQLIARNISITPQFIGRLPSGYSLGSIEILPDSIMIEDSVDIEKLTTTPIYLNGIRESTTVLCKIIVPQKLEAQDKKWPDVMVRLNIVHVEK